jgi:hypothetical protein
MRNRLRVDSLAVDVDVPVKDREVLQTYQLKTTSPLPLASCQFRQMLTCVAEGSAYEEPPPRPPPPESVLLLGQHRMTHRGRSGAGTSTPRRDRRRSASTLWQNRLADARLLRTGRTERCVLTGPRGGADALRKVAAQHCVWTGGVATAVVVRRPRPCRRGHYR